MVSKTKCLKFKTWIIRVIIVEKDYYFARILNKDQIHILGIKKKKKNLIVQKFISNNLNKLDCFSTKAKKKRKQSKGKNKK